MSAKHTLTISIWNRVGTEPRFSGGPTTTTVQPGTAEDALDTRMRRLKGACHDFRRTGMTLRWTEIRSVGGEVWEQEFTLIYADDAEDAA